MRFTSLLPLALLSLTASALPIEYAKRASPCKQVVSNVDNQGLPAAEKGAQGLGAALGSNGSGSNTASSASSTDSSKSSSNSRGSGKQSSSQGGSKSASSSSNSSGKDSSSKSSSSSSGKNSSSGSKSSSSSSSNNSGSNNNNSSSSDNNNSSGSKNNNNGTSTSSAASAQRTRVCDQGDQSLASSLNSLVTIHLGLQAATQTLSDDVSAKNVSADDVKTDSTRLQQFLDTATLQLQTATTIADDDSFAQDQLKSLASTLKDAQTTIKGLKGDASDANTLKTLQKTFLDATGTAQDGATNAVVDCFLPLTVSSG